MKATVTRVDVVKIQMVRDSTIPYAKTQISGPKDLVKLGSKFLKHADRELFVLVCLSTKNTVNCIHLVSMGTVNSTIVSPREVMKTALLSNATAIAFIHNHPSGNVEPSSEDVAITHRLAQCADLFQINVLDHVIVGDNDSYLSFAERGLIKKEYSTPSEVKEAAMKPKPDIAEKFTVQHYGDRFFGLYDEGALVCVTVYKKGAREVKRRLEALCNSVEQSASPAQQNKNEEVIPCGTNQPKNSCPHYPGFTKQSISP